MPHFLRTPTSQTKTRAQADHYCRFFFKSATGHNPLLPLRQHRKNQHGTPYKTQFSFTTMLALSTLAMAVDYALVLLLVTIGGMLASKGGTLSRTTCLLSGGVRRQCSHPLGPRVTFKKRHLCQYYYCRNNSVKCDSVSSKSSSSRSDYELDNENRTAAERRQGRRLSLFPRSGRRSRTNTW